MGAWSADPFGNDTALDWVHALERATDESVLLRPLRAALTGDPDAARCEEAVAAAAVVGAALNGATRALPDEASAWVERTAYAPDESAREAAAAALSRIREGSELRDLWDESPSREEWHREVDGLLAALRGSAGTPPAPKKPAPLPRTLPKLIGAIEPRETGPAREKLRQKLTALGDVDAPVPGTPSETPLCLLAAQGLVPEAELLLDRGADPERASALGYGPLVYAAAAGHADVVDLLLRRGAALHRELRVHPVTRSTVWADDDPGEPFIYSAALFSAVSAGAVAVVDVLARHGADPRQVDLNGETLLHKAAASGHAAMLRHLVDDGLPIDRPKAGGETALHYAARAGRVEAVRYLLSAGADANATSEWGETPYDLVDEDADPEMERLLETAGGRRSPEPE